VKWKTEGSLTLRGVKEIRRKLNLRNGLPLYWMKEGSSWYLKYLNVIDPSATGTIAVYESNTPEENSMDITKAMVVYPEEGSSRLMYYDLLSGTTDYVYTNSSVGSPLYVTISTPLVTTGRKSVFWVIQESGEMKIEGIEQDMCMEMAW